MAFLTLTAREASAIAGGSQFKHDAAEYHAEIMPYDGADISHLVQLVGDAALRGIQAMVGGVAEIIGSVTSE